MEPHYFISPRALAEKALEEKKKEGNESELTKQDEYINTLEFFKPVKDLEQALGHRQY